jgi:hypothetical protein
LAQISITDAETLVEVILASCQKRGTIWIDSKGFVEGHGPEKKFRATVFHLYVLPARLLKNYVLIKSISILVHCI